MKSGSSLPTSRTDKVAYLEAAAQHGEEIRERLTIGRSVTSLLDYAAATPELLVQETQYGLILTLGDLVEWQVTVDPEGRVLGYGFSGYGPLMEALGIDFSGQPYLPGNGG